MANASPLTFPFVYAKQVIALGAALPCACILVVVLRIYTRKLQRAALKADDWLVVCALFPMMGMGVCLITGAALGNMGYPTPPPPSDLTPAQSRTYLDPTTRDNQIILLMLALGLIKLSLISFYRRIFVVHRGSGTDVLLIVAAVIIALWAFALEMLIIFPCGKRIWVNWASPDTKVTLCPISLTSEYGLAYSDLITDVFVFLIPVVLVVRLNMATKGKLTVIGTFLLGASAIGASICRIIVYVEDTNASASGVAIDENLNQTLAYYWSMLEAGLALIAANLPPLTYLFNYIKEPASTCDGTVLRSLKNSWQKNPLWSRQTRGDSTNRVGGVKTEETNVEDESIADIR